MNGNKASGMFVRPDGTPFVFSMMRTCFFDELKPLIEENGGVLVPYDDAILSCDQAMTLTTEADTMTENIDNRLLFHFSFVTDSCEAKTLKDPLYYRVPVPTKHEIDDGQKVLQVLRGERKWSDFLPRPRRRLLLRDRDLSGESCSDIEEIQVKSNKRKIKTRKKPSPKRVAKSRSSANLARPGSESSESPIAPQRLYERQPYKRLRESANVDSNKDESPSQAQIDEPVQIDSTDSGEENNSEISANPECEKVAMTTPVKSIPSQEKVLSQTKREDTVDVSSKKSQEDTSDTPTRSKSYNDAHRPSPFRNNRPISRIRLFNHGKSGPERIDDYSDQEERDLRVQAKAAEVKLTQSNSIEEYAIFQSRLTKAFDMEKREKLRPILSILDVLVEYELLSELNLDSTWRFVSYLLCDDDMDNLISPKVLKAKFFSEILPSVLADFTQGLAPFYHKNEGLENRLHRRISSPRIVPLDSKIENRLVDILVGHDLFELESDVVWKFINISLPLEGYSHQEIREHFFEKILPRIDTFKSNFDGKMKEFQLWKSQSIPKKSINVLPENEPLEVSISSPDESEEANPVLNSETIEEIPIKKVHKNKSDLLLKDPAEFETDGENDIEPATPEPRRPYSREEDIKILDYIIKTCRWSEVNGVRLWRDVEKKQILPKRTYQSLKERFRRRILPKINTYSKNFSKADLHEIKRGANTNKR